MSILSKLQTAANEEINEEKDSVGGSGPVESGLYNHIINIAYVKKAASGALSLVVHFKDPNNREIRSTFWMTSGDAKGNKNYYEKDGEKFFLPGYNMANSLALLTVGKEIGELDTETKVINLWSSEVKAEVPTKVDMVMDLLNKPIISGVLKQTVNKTVKNTTTGAYEPTEDTRDENEIDKFFRASDRMTSSEIRAQADEATFIDTWATKWAGKTRDRTGGTKGTSGTAGAPPKPAAKKPAASLFASAA